MKVRALRGVCIGVDRHLMPGDVGDVDAASAQFLMSIGAVEVAPAPEPAPVEVAVEPEPKEVHLPVKAGKKEKFHAA